MSTEQLETNRLWRELSFQQNSKKNIEEIWQFHRNLNEYAPTPLFSLRRQARRLGLRNLLVKVEGERFYPSGSFKALGVSYALARLSAEIGPGTVLVAATEGNHGRAVAWSARLYGCKGHVVMPQHAARWRRKLIEQEGARLEVIDGSYDQAVKRAAEEARRPHRILISDQGFADYTEIPNWISQGYSTLFREVDEQLREQSGRPPDVVFLQAGVGSFACGAVTYYGARGRPFPRLVTVEPVAADALLASIRTEGGELAASAGSQATSMDCLNCATPSLAAWPILRKGVYAFLSITDERAQRAVAILEKEAGLKTTPSGAAGLGGLLAARDRIPGLDEKTTVLVVLTEGAAAKS